MLQPPKVKVRIEKCPDYGIDFWALIVEECPFCGKEHTHAAGMVRNHPEPMFLGQAVGAKCDGMKKYFLIQ